MKSNRFLPISKQDMIDRGWEELDFVLVSGDAYVDHHSFGAAIISRVLENAGYKVGIIAQPNWQDKEDFMKLGKPRLGFLVTAGNMDSMINHYTVAKKVRDKDYYSPGGVMGLRPDRATIVYCNRIREAFKNVPIIIGGIEASLRRFAHYDYWSDKVRKSILIDSSADLLVFGMGEKQIIEIADNLNHGLEAQYIRHIPGTSYVVDTLEDIHDFIEIPSYKEVSESKVKHAEAFKIQYDEQDPVRGKVLVQRDGVKYVVQNVPEIPLSREELDKVYALPYEKNYHPIYESQGGVPAIQEVKFSIVSSRGCFGSCSFCAITFHQGRIVQSRSQESILEEAIEMTKFDDFKGYIHDVGGPTANFRKPACKKQLKFGACKHRQCLHPTPCKHLDVDHKEYLNLLRKLRKLKGIKKVFVRSGLRYDYIMADRDDTFLKELIEHHVSGLLKVAPEHVCPQVLNHMGKPAGKTYENFRKKFNKITESVGKKQYIIPYLMSSHPGCTIDSSIKLAEYLRDINYQPEQVQDFYPTPGTLSTVMFYTGLDPLTMKEIYVPKKRSEKATQRALLQYSNPKYYDMIANALREANREDLIEGPKALLRPRGTRGKAKLSDKRTGKGRPKNNKGKDESKGTKNKEHSKENRRTTGKKNSKNRNSRNTKSRRR